MTRVRRLIDIQSCFSPLSHRDEEPVFLFVQDLQSVDDVFNIAWFWARDPKGLDHLSQVDMLASGLREPRLSKVFVDGHYDTLREPQLSKYVERQDYYNWHARWLEMEEVRIFHEALGLAADSLDTVRFLNLPVASFEWDGMFKDMFDL